jgi:hypothetical protein
VFEESQSDVLLLYEACHSSNARIGPAVAAGDGRGVVELIAAFGVYDTTKSGHLLFSSVVNRILQEVLAADESLFVSDFHHRLIEHATRICDPNAKNTTVYCCFPANDTGRKIKIGPVTSAALKADGDAHLRD